MSVMRDLLCARIRTLILQLLEFLDQSMILLVPRVFVAGKQLAIGSYVRVVQQKERASATAFDRGVTVVVRCVVPRASQMNFS